MIRGRGSLLPSQTASIFFGAQTDLFSLENADKKEVCPGEVKGPEVSCFPSPQGPSVSLGNDGAAVGGRLKFFLHQWGKISNNSWILTQLREGLVFSFLNPPPTRFLVTKLTDMSKHSALVLEIEELLKKEVLIPVPVAEEGKGFYSSLFLVKKPDETFRVILNLKPLNKFIVHQTFKMETIKSAVELLFPHCYMVCVDLKDAYYHIPIHPDFQKYLRVAVKMGERTLHFQYKALPFGIKIAPRIFTKIVSEMTAHLRESEGIIVPYLDDFLLVGESIQGVQKQLKRTLDVMKNLGWIVNREKSSLIPSKRQKFLGIILDSEVQKSFLPVEKVKVLQDLSLSLRALPATTIRKAMSLLGLFTAAIPAVPWAQIHSRPLQLQILAVWDHSKEGLDADLVLSQKTIDSLRWWTVLTNLEVGRSWKRDKMEVLTTDASPSGWGGHLHGQIFQGKWERVEGEGRSSNYRELLAVLKTTQAARESLRGKHIQILTDNITAVFYINKQGGTRCEALMQITYSLFALAEESFLSLSAVHIKGAENVKADFLSRHSLLRSEWSLNKQVFRMIVDLWGSPEIDLFATRKNRQVEKFCSLNPQERPWVVDALSVEWNWGLAYAFPPLPLIPRVLAKIREEKANVILIAPFWPKRAWFTLVRSLLITEPWVLPDREDLLWQGPIAHPQQKGLHLTAWPLRGRS